MRSVAPTAADASQSSRRPDIDSGEVDVLRTWAVPGPSDDPRDTRPKVYAVVTLAGGVTAFRKADSATEYVTHEASVLRALTGVPGVPVLLHQTGTALYTEFLHARPLQEAMIDLGVFAAIRSGWRLLRIVSRMHDGGVVHADIRPWNVLAVNDGRVCLIDFEYAYNMAEPGPPELLRVHHNEGLKTRLTDWIDTWQTLATLWAGSASRLVKSGLSTLALGVYWGLRLWRFPQHLWERGSRYRS